MSTSERKSYEQKAEVITKKLLSRLYALETRSLQARMQAEENINKLNKELGDLASQREELEKKYYDLAHASETQWKNVSEEFENLVNQINIDKQAFYEKAQTWLNDLNQKIADLEEKARHSGQEFRESTQPQLEYLRDQRVRLQSTLADLRKESGGRWQEIRSKIDEGLQNMSTGINNLYQNFQKRRQDYSAEKFYENAQVWLNDFSDNISDLEAKASQSTQDVNDAINQELDYVREQRHKIAQYLEDMKHETGERWKNFKSDIEERIYGVRSGIGKAYQYFQKGKEDTAQSESS
jgi:predicted  nucleic acid-binding Zn-ribbon protein